MWMNMKKTARAIKRRILKAPKSNGVLGQTTLDKLAALSLQT